MKTTFSEALERHDESPLCWSFVVEQLRAPSNITGGSSQTLVFEQVKIRLAFEASAIRFTIELTEPQKGMMAPPTQGQAATDVDTRRAVASESRLHLDTATLTKQVHFGGLLSLFSALLLVEGITRINAVSSIPWPASQWNGRSGLFPLGYLLLVSQQGHHHCSGNPASLSFS